MDIELERITSTHNSFYKLVKQLITSSKIRRKFGQTVIDGIHLCESYLQSIGEPSSCIVSDTALKNPEVVTILEKLDDRIISSMPDSLFEALNVVENGVGLLFVVNIPKSEAGDLNGDSLLLDDIQDPGNVGTLLRTAAAAGIKDVYMSADTAAAWSPKVLRAGMGAQFALSVYENVDLRSIVEGATVMTLATSLQADETIYEKDLKKPIAWIFGNEGRGVSEELLQLCDSTVTIPQESGVESLNVAASAAVCLFEQYRQRIS